MEKLLMAARRGSTWLRDWEKLDPLGRVEIGDFYVIFGVGY